MNEIDYSLFNLINGSIHLSFLDPIMVFITDSDRVMIGTILCMVLFLIVQKDKKRALILVIGATLAFALADSIAYRVLKPWFGRVRPSDSVYFLDGVNQLLTHGRFLLGTKDGFSTPSNHAANMFAQATYWSLLYPKWTKVLFPAAIVITWTRLYVGVHYPFDLFLGGVLGAAVAIAIHLILRKTPLKLPEYETVKN